MLISLKLITAGGNQRTPSKLHLYYVEAGIKLQLYRECLFTFSDFVKYDCEERTKKKGLLNFQTSCEITYCCQVIEEAEPIGGKS